MAIRTITRIDAVVAWWPSSHGRADAAFWTPAQAQFLREEFTEDADWAERVDQLNVMLRA